MYFAVETRRGRPSRVTLLGAELHIHTCIYIHFLMLLVLFRL